MSVYKGDKVVAGGSVDTYFVRKPAWSQAVAISAADLIAGYTAPADGLLVGWLLPTTGTLHVTVNDVDIAISGYLTTSGGWVSYGNAQCPVNSGDVIKVTGAAISQQIDINFVPFEDSTIAEPEVVTPELIRNMNTPDFTHPENISAAQINAGYTVQHRGLFIFTGYNDTSSGVRLKINGVDVAILYGVASSGPRCGYVQIPVKPGDIIKSEHVSSDALLCFVAPYLAQ